MAVPSPAALAVAALALVGAAGACSREPAFEDRTARVTIGARTTTFTLDSCGLDGQTVFLVGRTDGGDVLQAVVGVEADGETGVPASTGIDVDHDVAPQVAFGDEAWARRGETGDAPGEIHEARVRGARIQASGEAVTLDDDGAPTGAAPVAIALDARCDADDE